MMLIADIDKILPVLECLDDPAIKALLLTKQDLREQLLDRLRAGMPLYLRCKIAAEVRDRASRRHLDLLGKKQALEKLLVLKTAELDDSAAEVERAQAVYEDLATAHKAELAQQALLLSTAPPREVQPAPAPTTPLQAALSMLEVLPEDAATSFREWLATVSSDQLHGRLHDLADADMPGTGGPGDGAGGDVGLQSEETPPDFTAEAAALYAALPTSAKEHGLQATPTEEPPPGSTFQPFRVRAATRVDPYSAHQEDVEGSRLSGFGEATPQPDRM